MILGEIRERVGKLTAVMERCGDQPAQLPLVPPSLDRRGSAITRDSEIARGLSVAQRIGVRDWRLPFEVAVLVAPPFVNFEL